MFSGLDVIKCESERLREFTQKKGLCFMLNDYENSNKDLLKRSIKQTELDHYA